MMQQHCTLYILVNVTTSVASCSVGMVVDFATPASALARVADSDDLECTGGREGSQMRLQKEREP